MRFTATVRHRRPGCETPSRSPTTSPTSTPRAWRPSSGACARRARPRSSSARARGRSSRRTGSPTSSACAACSPTIVHRHAGPRRARPGHELRLRGRRAQPASRRGSWCSPTSTRPASTAGARRAPSWSPSSARPARRGPMPCSPRSTSASTSSASRTCTGPTARWSTCRAWLAAARDAGAALVIDASQSCGAMPLDVSRDPARLPRRRRLQVAARPVRPRLPVRRRAPPRRRADRAELDQPRRLGGLRAAGRLPRRLPARRAPVRRRPAHELHADADGDRRAHADPRVGRRDDLARAAGDHRADRSRRRRRT